MHFQTDFPPGEFAARWSKVYGRIWPQAIALVQGNGLEGGFAYPRQPNEFHYLTGVETPHSFLLLDGRTRKSTLLLPPRNRRLEQSEGRVLSADDPQLATPQRQRGDFPRPLGRPSLPRTTIRQPRAKIEDLTAILDELRSLKSPREIALIKRASQLAGYGILEAMKATRPGLFEYHLDAAARYVLLSGGARLEAYRSITASGTSNIWNGHYFRNASQLKSGDLILYGFRPRLSVLHKRRHPHGARQRQVQPGPKGAPRLRARILRRRHLPHSPRRIRRPAPRRGLHCDGTGLCALEVLPTQV